MGLINALIDTLDKEVGGTGDAEKNRRTEKVHRETPRRERRATENPVLATDDSSNSQRATFETGPNR